METKKVYVLTVSSVSDSVEDKPEVKVFSAIKKAKEEMQKRYEAEKQDFMDAYDEDDVIGEIDDKSASVYLLGYYGEEHIDFLITECEIE